MDHLSENAHRRKKDPERVKKLILENTMRLVAEQGVSGVSIQSVALLSGITKGGVFHHFANKQILLEAMLADLLVQFDNEINEQIKNDPIAFGRFTRAYIHVTLSSTVALNLLWSALGKALMTEKIYCDQWNHWLEQRLILHTDTDSHIHLKILRYAADGLWYMENLASQNQPDFKTIQSELLLKAYPENF